MHVKIEAVSIVPATTLNRPATVFAVLSLIAIAGFAGVTRLANRYQEQQKAFARRLFARGVENQKDSRFDRAIEDFRAALTYDHDNSQYQLSLARALRDTGRTSEAEAYLVNLWERSPQDGFVNLALGRLAAREALTEKAIQYYHNAAYGVWPSNAEANRRNVEFELIEFLLRQGARPQAEAELIAFSAAIPNDPGILTRTAELFAKAGTLERSLPLYQRALQLDPKSPSALKGAGAAAFQIGHYREAENYLRQAMEVDTNDNESRELLETSTLLLLMDPFEPHLGSTERLRRLRAAVAQAGKRLSQCSAAADSTDSTLAGLNTSWVQMNNRVEHLTSMDTEASDAAMALIAQIEEETQKQCGTGGPADRALHLLSAKRNGGEQ
ncbi:MAG TPA: tetratricopeptide repeat protein [Terriglobales bacterium]